MRTRLEARTTVRASGRGAGPAAAVGPCPSAPPAARAASIGGRRHDANGTASQVRTSSVRAAFGATVKRR